jgi:hypothetical protein
MKKRFATHNETKRIRRHGPPWEGPALAAPDTTTKRQVCAAPAEALGNPTAGRGPGGLRPVVGPIPSWNGMGDHSPSGIGRSASTARTDPITLKASSLINRLQLEWPAAGRGRSTDREDRKRGLKGHYFSHAHFQLVHNCF